VGVPQLPAPPGIDSICACPGLLSTSAFTMAFVSTIRQEDGRQFQISSPSEASSRLRNWGTTPGSTKLFPSSSGVPLAFILSSATKKTLIRSESTIGMRFDTLRRFLTTPARAPRRVIVIDEVNDVKTLASLLKAALLLRPVRLRSLSISSFFEIFTRSSRPATPPEGKVNGALTDRRRKFVNCIVY
jgi:hypothetical protein